jgi:hemolysin activation/secretion protein
VTPVAAIAAGSVTLAMAGAALAQVPLPSPADPSRIDERLAPQRPGPRLPQAPLVRDPAPAAVPEALRALRITLREIRFEGASVIPRARLEERARRYVGREVSGEELFELARELTALYRAEGYLLSQVIVPPQSLAERRLTLRVVEGYIAEVRVEGDADVAPTLAALGEKIKASRPLHAAALERYLLLANDLAGTQLRSVLTPSSTPGAADLTLIASVRKVEGYAALDNYGSKYLGPGQFSAGVALNRLLGNDQLRLGGVTTGNGEMNYGQVSYSNVLTTEGLRLGASASRARTRPGFLLEPFEVRGLADTFTLTAGYPLWRTRNGSVLGRATFDMRNVDSEVLGVRVIEDRVRALRAGLTWLALDRLDGANTLDLEFSQGVGGTDENDPLKSRAGAQARSSRFNLDYERYQPLGRGFGVTFGFAGQWSDEPLLSPEQFALGGRRLGRAYEPAELVGDRGWAVRLEPSYVGRSAGWVTTYQLYGFYDGGQVRDDESVASGDPTRSLASAGFGTRLDLGRHVSAALEAAWPLTRPVASYQVSGEGDEVRILGSLSLRF